MSDKITESSWKAFVKGLKLETELDDKDLLKLLQRLDKTDARKPEPRLDALKDLLKELPRQVAAATKLKKALGDKPFGKIKDELYAMLDEAEALQKKTQAALDEAEPEDAEEDGPASALADPKLLLKQLKLCRQDPERTVAFAFVDGKDKQPAMLAMHPRMTARKLFAKLQEAAGVKTGSFGSAWVDGSSLMLQLDKPLGGLVKKIRQPVKSCGFKIAKAVLWNEDGTVFEQDEEAEESVGVPEAPALPVQTYADKLAALQARVRQAAEAGGPDGAKHAKLLDFAAGKAQAGDHLGALAALKQLERLLDEPTPVTPTPGQDGGVDAGLAFKARLGALIPKVKEAATAQHPAADAARLKASEAGVLAAKRDFAGAQRLLDELEELLAGQAPVTPSRSSAEQNPVDLWNELRGKLQPLVDDALKTPGDRADKARNAWALALESARSGDFGRADLIARKLQDMLAKPLPTTTTEHGDRPGGTPVGNTQALLAARAEIGRLRALVKAFGPSVPPLWESRLEEAEQAVESVAAGTLEAIENGARSSGLILQDLEPKVADLTGKKRDFERQAEALAARQKALGERHMVVNDILLKQRVDALAVSLQQARDEATAFRYDEALLALQEVARKADAVDRDADALEKNKAVFDARRDLYNEFTLVANSTVGPSPELIEAHSAVQSAWNTLYDRWNAHAHAEALAASDQLPALIATFKRKTEIFNQVNGGAAWLVDQLRQDRLTHGDRFELLYPKSLIDGIARFADTNYRFRLDDQTYGNIKGLDAQLRAVRLRANTGVAYFQARDALAQTSRDLLADERSRRALRYVAPDYREKIQDAQSQGKAAADRQEFDKALPAVDAGRRYADQRQLDVNRCLLYLAALDKTDDQLEKVQQQHTTASAKAAAQACLARRMQAESLAVARDFDAAQAQLAFVRTLLDDIQAAENIAASLANARQAPERQPGSDEMNQDIALIESAIQSAEASSAQTGVAFEWTTLSAAKLSLAALRRANRDGDAGTANEARRTALAELAGLAEQLSSYKTARALHTALQTALTTAQTPFGTLAANTLPVARLLATEFQDIQAQTATRATQPLAGGRQPAFAGILEALAELEGRLADWNAAMKALATFTTDAGLAETALAALETTDVPAIALAYAGYHALFKVPLQQLRPEQRLLALRQRKDSVAGGVTVSGLAQAAVDMKAILAEAAMQQRQAAELRAAAEFVGTRIATWAADVQARVTQLGRQSALDPLISALEAAARANDASGIRIAANEIGRFDFMLWQLSGQRTDFLNKHTPADSRLQALQGDLTNLPGSQAVNQAAAVLRDQRAAPIATELERLRLAGEADALAYGTTVVDIDKCLPQIDRLETDIRGLQALAAAAQTLERQLNALAAFVHVPAFKAVHERAEALQQSAGLAMAASPPDYAKAQADIAAAGRLAKAATDASTGPAEPDPSSGGGSKAEYLEACRQLRARHLKLATVGNDLALDPQGLAPLQSAVDNIEQLATELA